jgi:hypothetical protein
MVYRGMGPVPNPSVEEESSLLGHLSWFVVVEEMLLAPNSQFLVEPVQVSEADKRGGGGAKREREKFIDNQ